VTSHDLDGVALVRVSAESGRVRVVGESRPDLDVGGGEVERHGDVLTVMTGNGRVEVRVPEGTDLVVGNSSGRVSLSGRLGNVAVASESGRISVDRAEAVDVRSVSGRIEVEAAGAGCRARTVSGGIVVGEATDLDVHTESGRIRVDRVRGNVRARTTSGRIELGVDGASDIVAETISGRIVLALAAGLGADVDLTTSAGRIDNAAPSGDDCRVVARSGSGRVQVRSR
jgi:DUF4097 and DUF4098 domain-containing protein YvlB